MSDQAQHRRGPRIDRTGEKAQVAVIGAGLMGHGIAQVFACAGHLVTVYDTQAEMLATLRSRVRQNLIDLELDPVAADLVYAVEDFGECVAGADVVFEAGPEDLAFKQKTFERLQLLAPKTALLASNTSVIPITDVTKSIKTGHRAMGTHWWNPPYLVPLVEVVKTADTDPDLALQMCALLTSVGKTPALIEKDVPGFVGNRLQHALWREAVALVAEGVCDANTVDTVVKASFGRRLPVLGPLENADLVGIELTLAIHEVVLPHIDRSPGPSPYLRKLIDEGRLGMKSGEGFQKWTPEDQAQLRKRVFEHLKRMNAQQET